MADKTPLEVLRETREILTDPLVWVDGEWVTPGFKHGREVPFCYCLDGALKEAAGWPKNPLGDFDLAIEPDEVPTYAEAARFLVDVIDATAPADYLRRPARPEVVIYSFNDRTGRSHQEVLDILDQAIGQAMQVYG